MIFPAFRMSPQLAHGVGFGPLLLRGFKMRIITAREPVFPIQRSSWQPGLADTMHEDVHVPGLSAGLIFISTIDGFRLTPLPDNKRKGWLRAVRLERWIC